MRVQDDLFPRHLLHLHACTAASLAPTFWGQKSGAETEEWREIRVLAVWGGRARGKHAP